jgi:uncharacterized protein YbaR (Trm112 family)
MWWEIEVLISSLLIGLEPRPSWCLQDTGRANGNISGSSGRQSLTMSPLISMSQFNGSFFRNRSGTIFKEERRREMVLSKELLEILACPKCKGDIFLNRTGDGLICKACRLVYPIKEDIPVMLIDEALPYKGEE